MIIYSWHSPADEIMQKCAHDYDPECVRISSRETEIKNMTRYELIDFIYNLNRAGLNVMIPKDFPDTRRIFVDTKYFSQR
jgi:hypothetical protein